MTPPASAVHSGPHRIGLARSDAAGRNSGDGAIGPIRIRKWREAWHGRGSTAQIVAPGGYIAAAARCNDGFPEHGNFKRLLFDHGSPRALLDTIMSPGFSMYDQWEAQLLAGVLLKARVGLYSELPSENVRRAHLEPITDLEETLSAELQRVGADAPIAVLPEGPMTIPYVEA